MTSRVHAFTDDALGDYDATDLARQIAAGKVSANEAVEAAIARTERVNPLLNALHHADYAKAREIANAGRSGSFAGVPTFIKDNVEVKGMPTRYGSDAFSDRTAKRNAAPASQLLEQGYIALGKTALPEWGLTASTEFVNRPGTSNPWDIGRSVGASSGGSAALVAAGAVPIAHANDGAGSIRIPAAMNGLVGLKPTRGRHLDQSGARQLPINLAAEGVVTRTVRDTAHHFAALERVRPNRQLPAIGLVERPSGRRLRVGMFTDTVAGDVDAEIAATVAAAGALLEDLGHDVVEIPAPFEAAFIEEFKVYWGFFAVALAGSSKVTHRGDFRIDHLDPFTREMIRIGLHQVPRWPLAIRKLRRLGAAYNAQFQNYDVLLSPVVSQPAPRLGYLSPAISFEEFFARTTAFVGFTPINNVSGNPAISLPFGTISGGMPGSIHIAAAPGDEKTLLELAFEVEAANPFPLITAMEKTK